MAFPSTISAFNTVNSTDKLSSPSHSALHNTVSAAVTQIQNVIGIDGSSSGTIIGDLRNSASGGGGHVQTAALGGTGQVSFNKGDILVAQSNSVLTKLAIGDNLAVLTADSSKAVGIKWGTQGIVKTFVTKSPLGSSSVVATAMNSSLLGYTGLFNLPVSMSVNNITLDVASVLIQGTFRVGIFTEDGQTQATSVLFSSITTNGVKSSNVSSVLLGAGNYYSVVTPIDGNVAIKSWPTNASPGDGFSSIIGKQFYSGTQVITANNLPFSFVPSILTAANGETIVMRLDN